ncbi:MAG: hypothetical protein ABJA83_14135, partial [Burkholderiaceae bacterium]
KLGAGNESRTRDLNLGKVSAAPSFTATHPNITLNSAQLLAVAPWVLMWPDVLYAIVEAEAFEGSWR